MRRSRYFALFAALVLLLGFAMNLAGTIPTVDAATNLALNKPVSFSSEQSTNPATNVVDGSTSTRWSAEGFPNWVRVDFGASYSVDKVEIAPYQSRAYQYKVEVSTDGTNWTQVVDRTTNTTGASVLANTFGSVNARYARLTVTAPPSDYTGGWASITEFRVFEATSTNPTPTPSPTPTPTQGGGGSTVYVSNNSQLSTELSSATAGKTIILRNGTYSGLTITKNGASGSPITLKAENRHGAIFNGTVTIKSSTYIVLEGFKFTGSSTAVKLEASKNVHVTRNDFALSGSASIKWLLIKSTQNVLNSSGNNRVSYNDFHGKDQNGNYISLEDSVDMGAISVNDRIDHNYFRTIAANTVSDNEREAIRIGLSGISHLTANTTVDYNLFENCDGDPEVISVKAGGVKILNNTVRNSLGSIVLRHGNGSQVNNNFIFGANRSGPSGSNTIYTGGIRIYGENHDISGNWIEGTNGFNWSAPIAVNNGDADNLTASTSDKTKHFVPKNITLSNNQLKDNAYGIEIGFNNSGNYTIKPSGISFSGNKIVGSQNQLINYVTTPQSGISWTSNVVRANSPATVGLSPLPSGITVDNGLTLTQPSGALTSAQVGPNAP